LWRQPSECSDREAIDQAPPQRYARGDRGNREYRGWLTLAEYEQSWQIRRAVERGVEIISDASRHIPDDLKQRYPRIFWREIAGIGNLLRHEYGHVDNRVMWRVVEKYLPELKSVVIDMLHLQKLPRSRS
jgi:uncharacterized protein with HEPN domain